LTGLAVDARAECHCFCKAVFSPDRSNEHSIPDPVIDYGQIKRWGNCTAAVGQKRRECKQECGQKIREDASRWGNDSWLCAHPRRQADDRSITVYAAIGTQKYESAGSRSFTCSGGPVDPDPPSPGCFRWTQWFDRDNASGSGDYETLKDLASQVPCQPVAVQCQTLAGAEWWTTGQSYTCRPDVGGVCANSGQTCSDYRVRFLCPG
jgi:hypothetical protein